MRKQNIQRRHARRAQVLFVAAAAAASCSARLTLAQDNWIAGNGNWSNPADWAPAAVPANGAPVNIGIGNTASFTVTYDYTGAAVTLSTLTINTTNAGSTTAATLSMSANNLTSGYEYVGDSGGVATFNQSGGVNTASSEFDVGFNIGNTGTYNLSNTGTLSGFTENIGDNGVGNFTESGGDNSTFTIAVGDNAGANGIYTLSGTGSVSLTGNEYVGFNGSGTFNQTGGTNAISSERALFLGYNIGAAGSYTLSGTGTLAPGSEYIGNFGAGYFNQTGGTNTIASTLTVGYDGPTSTYSLSSTGAMSVAIEEVGFYTAGIFNQTGGTNTIASELDIAYVAGSTGSYTLSGGKLIIQAGGAYIGGSGPLTSNVPGGTGNLTIGNSGQLSVTGPMVVYKNGRVNINGGSASVGGLTISSSGVMNVNASLAINYGSPANDPISTIVGYLTNGYSGATAWTGTSTLSGVITSTSAAASGRVATLGYLDGNIDTADSAEVAPNQIVVKYTLVGDANLDGIVNFTDFATVLKNFDQAGTDWAQGNFEYASNSPSIAATNFNDFADVLKNFLQPLPGAGAGETLGGTSQPLAAAVQVHNAVAPLPEPTSLTLLAAAAAGLLGRRRRRA